MGHDSGSKRSETDPLREFVARVVDQIEKNKIKAEKENDHRYPQTEMMTEERQSRQRSGAVI